MKTRKSLISKNKKETLLSKINLSALKVVWLLGFGLVFSSVVLALTQQFYTDFKFLKNAWVEIATEITIDNTIYLDLEVMSANLPVATDLQGTLDQLRMLHMGPINDQHTEEFNQGILDSHLTLSSAAYDQVFFNNLCLALSLTPTMLTECQSLVGSKLKSGYEVYSKYLISPEVALSQ
jgi:hypothetical protein